MRMAQLSRATGARLTQELPASLPMATAGHTALPAPPAANAGVTPAVIVKKRPGYCECCTVRYEDLKMVSFAGCQNGGNVFQ